MASVGLIWISFHPEAMPGNIRRAEHFIAFLRRFNEYLKVHVVCVCVAVKCRGISGDHVTSESASREARGLGDPPVLPATHSADHLY